MPRLTALIGILRQRVQRGKVITAKLGFRVDFTNQNKITEIIIKVFGYYGSSSTGLMVQRQNGLVFIGSGCGGQIKRWKIDFVKQAAQIDSTVIL